MIIFINIIINKWDFEKLKLFGIVEKICSKDVEQKKNNIQNIKVIKIMSMKKIDNFFKI